MKVKPRSLLQSFDKVLVMLGLLLFSRAFVEFFETGSQLAMWSQRLAYGAVYGAIALRIVVHLRRFLYLVLRDKLLVFLILYVLASILWSDVPGITGRRLVVFLGATAFGIYMSMLYDLQSQMKYLTWVFGISAVLSLAFVILWPEIGLTRSGIPTSLWKGIYGHKNALGRIMALSSGLFWLNISESNKLNLPAWSGFISSIALTWFSTSITSWAVCLGMVILVSAYRRTPWRDDSAIPIVVLFGAFLLILLFVLAAMNAEVLFPFLGKSLTLSGRLPLWHDLLMKLKDRYLLGFGYNGFWLGPEGESADIWYKYGWHPEHAHNGFLDMALSLGIVGIGTIALHFMLSVKRSILLMRLGKKLEGLWSLLYLSFLIMANFTYSILLSQFVFFWALYVASVVAVHVQFDRSLKEQRVT